jgi:nucleoside-diphosphate-sugar epimerase
MATMQSESQKIAVTGATGRVGSHVVEILQQRGHDVVPIFASRGDSFEIAGPSFEEWLAAA